MNTNTPKNEGKTTPHTMNAFQNFFQKESGKAMFKWSLTVLILLCALPSFSQTYQTNGTAVNDGNGLVQLTAEGIGNQTASAWSTTKLDLTQPFDMSFEMFFGCDAGPNGGDGMTFTLHNDPRGLNAIGAGFGFLGLGGGPGTMISPAVSIEFDTYDGSLVGGGNEIANDHIAIDLNGDVNQTTNLFIGSGGTPVSVQAILGGRDLESCAANANNFYTIRITWDPAIKELKLYEEGTLTLTYTKDMITDIFGSVNEVYWGFTGATGSASNEQWIAPVGEIIPWQCSAANSCCLPFTLTPSGPTSICNNPITLGFVDTYNNYSWSTGETTPTIDVSAPGTYSVTVQQSQGGNLCPGTHTITVTSSGATAVLSGDATLCSSTGTTTLSVALGGTAPWNLVYAIDGVAQPAVTGITTSPYTFQGTPTHVYTLVSASDNSSCASVVSGSATVDQYPVPVGIDNSFIAPASTTLSVVDDGGVYQWYDAPTGGTLLYTGVTFTTPVLSATTTYYVNNASVISLVRKSAALHDRTSGDGSNLNDIASGLPPAVTYLDFTANSNFTFDTLTATVLSSGAGTGRVTVYITSYTYPGPFAGAETIAKDSINIPISAAGVQDIIIPINLACVAGTNYHISYSASGVLQTQMYWNMMNAASYPINTQPELTIQQYGVPNTRYPGLFNWRISSLTAAAVCGRTPVTAYTCPTATISGSATLCNDGSTTPLTVVLTGQGPWSLTYAIDGVSQPAINGIAASPYIITSQPGAHTYTLVSVSNADATCTANNVSGSAVISLTAQSPIGHDDNFTAPGTADLSVDATGDTFEWYDAATGGTLVYTGTNFTTGTLTGTTTYYVNNASIVNVVHKSAALLNRTSGDGSNLNDQADGLPPAVCYLDFTANSSFNFDTLTATVNATGTGTGQVTVYITSYTYPGPFAGGETVAKDSINIPITATGVQDIKIPLNYPCVAGTNYHISYLAAGVLQTKMYWNMMNAASFPITTVPELTIQQYGVPNTRYPGLFNWRISITSATPTCGRTPVTAYVCPTATISGTATICDDGTTTTPISIALTGDAPWTITYAIDGVSQTPITTNVSPYVFQSQSGAHVYTVSSVTTSHSTGCAANVSGTATVTLNPAAPTGHDASFVPPNPANLSVDNTGGTYNWYDAPTGGNLLHTGATYSPAPTSTTTYYVEQVIGTDVSCTRTPVTAYLCPTGTISGDASICDDGVATTPISVALTGAAPWSLTYAIDGVAQTQITGITTSPYVFSSATGAHVYTLTAVSNANSTGCTANIGGSATVSLNPVAPIGHDDTFLAPGTADLTVDNTGGTYNWYDAPTGGNLVFSGLAYTTPTLTATTTYYVEQVVSSNSSCTRTPVTAYACPTGIISGTGTICNDGTTTTPLSVALTGTSPWSITYAIDGVAQSAITGITTSPYVFQSATGAHTYTLTAVSTANSAGCSGNTSGTATVSVNPAAPVGHDTTFVAPAATQLSVSNTGGIYNWYDAAVGGTLVFSGTIFNTPVLNGTTSYYVEQVVSSVASCTRTVVTAVAVLPTEPLFFPNLVTPNGDGNNDMFVIKGLPANSNVAVYNSWGSKVYDNKAYKNDWAPQETDGMYYYDVKMPDGNEYHGWLHIVR